MILKKNKQLNKFYSNSGSRCILRIARKFNECVECGGIIEMGEKYLEITYIGDDYNHHTIKVCKSCRERY